MVCVWLIIIMCFISLSSFQDESGPTRKRVDRKHFKCGECSCFWILWKDFRKFYEHFNIRMLFSFQLGNYFIFWNCPALVMFSMLCKVIVLSCDHVVVKPMAWIKLMTVQCRTVLCTARVCVCVCDWRQMGKYSKHICFSTAEGAGLRLHHGAGGCSSH